MDICAPYVESQNHFSNQQHTEVVHLNPKYVCVCVCLVQLHLNAVYMHTDPYQPTMKDTFNEACSIKIRGGDVCVKAEKQVVGIVHFRGET